MKQTVSIIKKNEPYKINKTKMRKNKYSISESQLFSKKREINISITLPYLRKQFEHNGTIDNFRIAAGLIKGNHRGFFYNDSDLHKWADAVCTSLSYCEDPLLYQYLEEYTTLMARAQTDDGYLYTYNQINFPDRRWENIFVESELYCMGHFIEACIEHSIYALNDKMLSLAGKTADLIIRNFNDRGARSTPGHQQIEIALQKLYRVTGRGEYGRMADHFLLKRGRLLFPGVALLRDYRSHLRKRKELETQIGEKRGFDFEENSIPPDARWLKLRLFTSILSGKYQQQHKPVIKQKEPVGHAVRWVYQGIASAMSFNKDLRNAVIKSWSNMVSNKMYVTGGIGALPLIEGFGKKDELPDDLAYCETCAAIGSVLLNQQLFENTKDVKYADLLEWQLYNAVLVGSGVNGSSFLYRNPLLANGQIQRKEWYNTACCVTNIPRILSRVERFVCYLEKDTVYLNQYISGNYSLSNNEIVISVKSGLPWEGRSAITINNTTGRPVSVKMRVPGWAKYGKVQVEGHEDYHLFSHVDDNKNVSDIIDTSIYFTQEVPVIKKFLINLEFNMDINFLDPSERKSRNKGRRVVTRGPLVYCYELPVNDMQREFDPFFDISTISLCKNRDKYIGNVNYYSIQDEKGVNYRLVPYFYWGNTDKSKMRVWLKI
ncbi:MAG: glycoside hydrolase family 127 protein [Spirochaetes bacterium]|nr:glycoside hydrolase family 127 protein [Spirochaetota bacterium]